MSDPGSRLFRKAALDRLSAPEELETVMTVAPPRSWLALAAIGLLFAAVLAWGIGGRLRTEVTASGVCVRGPLVPGRPLFGATSGEPLEAVVFLPIRVARQLSAGAPALVLPAAYSPAEYGYITGTVAEVGDAAAERHAMQATLGDDRLVDRLWADGPLVAARVRLTPDAQTASGVHWSSSQGPAAALPSGAPCTASVTVAAHRPVTVVVPALQRIFGE
jgi:hypothetical protein